MFGWVKQGSSSQVSVKDQSVNGGHRGKMTSSVLDILGLSCLWQIYTEIYLWTVYSSADISGWEIGIWVAPVL